LSAPVFLVVSVLDGSGPGRVLTTLAQHLGDDWEPVLVATHGPRQSALIDEARRDGIAVEHLGMRGIWDVAGPTRFRGLLRRYRPAVVHTRTIRADLIGRVAAMSGVPVLNNLVNLYPHDSVALHGRAAGGVLVSLTKATGRAARLFVANAEAVADNARATFGLPEDRVRVVYDGLDLSRWADAAPADLGALGISVDDVVGACVARLHPQKGLEDLATAAGMLRDEPALHLAVVGDGPSRADVQRAIDQAGAGGRMHLLGHRDDVAAILARADFFVLPSRFEGLPSAIIEAMAASLPIVATDVGGVREMIDADSGWLVPAHAPTELANAIGSALAADRSAMGKRARAQAEARFDATVMAAEFAKLYRELAS
jgi:glycosyltransferase involved in cell wall biosynthesis